MLMFSISAARVRVLQPECIVDRVYVWRESDIVMAQILTEEPPVSRVVRICMPIQTTSS